MFHFKKTTIICACLFLVSLVLIFFAQLSQIVVLISLITFTGAFGLLTYILIDEYLVFCKMQEEKKYELLMELSITENAEEYISNPDFYNKTDLKRIKAQRKNKLAFIILSVVMTLCFLLLFVLRIAL